MPRSAPDWSSLRTETVFPRRQDLAELAARLGSPVTHDRRGDVYWWDDFECGLAKWTAFTSGTGASVSLSTDRARNGRRSCLLTAGSDASAYAEIDHYSPFLQPVSFGLEVSFSLASLIDRFSLTIQYDDGAAMYLFRVYWVDADDTLQYIDSSGVPVTFASGLNLLREASMFHVAKLVVSYRSGQYVRFLLNDASYPLSGIAGQATPSSGTPYVYISLLLLGRTGSNDQVYVDDVILTLNDPL